MFGFNKSKPLIDGPVEFEAEVKIDCPASHVFPLLDVSDPRFNQVALGNSVKKVGDDTFEIVLSELDDMSFRLKVLKVEQDKQHTAEVSIEPVGNLVSAIEDYQIVSTGDKSCKVKLVTKATFADHLSDEDVAQEAAVMSMALEEDLTKLKIHAEEGVDAVHAFNEEQNMGFDIEFDLGDLDIEWDEIDSDE